ncbi:MAG: SDR family oxidoreductase [Calditrichales bacterium]|nr:SDR family oxidoreductase [Calditrichales bacterium]
MNENITNKTALITGASTGIGYELTKLFAKDGYDLVLTARNEQRLNQIKKELSLDYDIDIKIIAKDLSLSNAPQEIYEELQKAEITIDVLVNNAGFGLHGLFAASDLKAGLEMMQLNMVSLTHLTRLFLDGMIQRESGRILNVASTAAFQPGPLMAVYYATKAYVLSFSEALGNELKNSGISVTALCPGPTITEFQNRAGIGNSKLFKGNAVATMDAISVARKGYQALMKGKAVIIPGFINKAMSKSVRFMPRCMVLKTVRWIMEKR